MDGPNTYRMPGPQDVTSWALVHTVRNVVQDDGRGMTLRDEWWHVPSFVLQQVEAEATLDAYRTARAAVEAERRGVESISRETGRPIEDTFRVHGLTLAIAAIDSLIEGVERG